MKSVGDVARLIPGEVRRPRALRSWLTFLRVFAMLFLTQLALWLVPGGPAWWPVKFVLIFFAGLAFVGIFVLGHDCGHYSFSSRRWVNDLVGTLCHLPILNGFYAWREAHDFHHRRTQIRKVDPDWPELLYAEGEDVPWHVKLAVRLGPGSPVGIFVGFWVGMLKRALFGLLIPQMPVRTEEKWKIYPHTFVSFILAVILLREYYLLIGATKFVEMYVFPAIIGTSFGALLTFLHHTHEGSPVFDEEGYESFQAQVGATWNVRFPRFMEWMWLDINIHLPHHVLPNLPWYQLRTATEIIRAARPELIKEKSWSWQTMQESWRATRLERTGEGKYRLSSSLKSE